MRRRRFLFGSALATGAVAAGGAAWLAGSPAPVARFATLDDARQWLARVTLAPAVGSLTAWSPAEVLEHCAQSVEYSIIGYPQAKPAWFQATAGSLAFASFRRHGAMAHDTLEPIPGAPPLGMGSVPDAASRLTQALSLFEQYRGPLQPHFAYGPLDHADYTRAHLMHLADHAAGITGVA